MTIQDMIDAGIRIQGAYSICTVKDETTYKVLAEGSSLEDEVCDIDNDILEREITFMYPVTIATDPKIHGSKIAFEVE